MKSRLHSPLYTLYKDQLKGYIITGIPVLIIFYLSHLYTPNYPLYIEFWVLIVLPLVGLISPDEFEDHQFVLLDRASTKGQDPDFDARLQPMRDRINDDINGNIVKEFTSIESGATMEREDLDEILAMAEAGNMDVVGVNSLDRFSRANPWDTIKYLIELRETEVTLYEDPRKFYDWDDLGDYQLLAHGLFFSREWYNQLSKGRRDGVLRELRKGRWPFKPHFGYEKRDPDDEDARNIFLDGSKGPIIYRMFDLLEIERNISAVLDEINERFEDELDKPLTYGRLRTVLASQLCIGKLAYEGEVVNELPDLAVIPEGKFEQVQDIIAAKSRGKTNPIPDPVIDLATEFGIEYANSILEQISFRECKECGGLLDDYSTTTIWGDIPVQKVRCQSCDYDGPLVSEKELREIHMTAPLRCPFCLECESFEVEESPHGMSMHHYVCSTCDHGFHTDVSPDKLERYLKYPDLGTVIEDNRLVPRHSHSSPESSESAGENAQLSDFGTAS